MEQHQDFWTAIASQPDCMRHAAELASQVMADAHVTAWGPSETIAIAGMGSSTNAGAVFTEAMRQAGRRVINLDASAVAHYPERCDLADHLIVISESGRSPEPIAAAKRIGLKPVVITNVPGSPVCELSDVVVPLGGFMDSGVYTIGYTTTLVALAAIAQAHGVTLADPASLGDVAESVLQNFGQELGDDAEALNRASFLDIVGQGVSAGSAQAAALLFRESTQMPTAAHQTIQYLHGPMECVHPGNAVLVFGEGREDALVSQLDGAGASVFQFVGNAWATRALGVPTSGYATAVADIVYAQCLAAQLSALRGIQVGKFRFSQPDTKLPQA